MENILKLPPVSEHDLFYYRQRSKNRIFEAISAFIADEAQRKGITKRDIADCLHKDPSQITRWLTSPSNITVDTISDLLLCMGAEMDYFIAKFEERPAPNEMHPLLAKLSVSTVVDYKQNKPSNPYQPLSSTKTDAVTPNPVMQ